MIKTIQRKGPTRILSEYIAAKRYEDIPATVREKIKILLLDSLGCSIGGSTLKPGKMILSFFEGLGGINESSIHATGRKIPCIHAGYVNSALSNILDFDDTLIDKGIGHPGATVVHPALAVAEKVSGHGKDILNAICLGYELSVKILNAMAPTPERMKQVWGLATFQIFGAVTASCKLLGFDADRIASAFGLAGFCAPVPFVRKIGTVERPTSWLKNNFGWTSMGGVMSALQAAEGFQGSTYILDGDKSFWIMAGSDQYDFEELTRGLGEDYKFIEKISFKPYAVCRFTHTAIDALKMIKSKHTISPKDIARIKAETFYEAFKFSTYRGLNIIEAQYSLPYVIALELLDRSPSQGLSERDLDDEDVLRIADLVSLEVDPDTERLFVEQHLMPSSITIEMKNGQSVQGKAEIPRGDLRKPLSDEEIIQKFRDIVWPLLGENNAERIIRDCMNLDMSQGPLRVHLD